MSILRAAMRPLSAYIEYTIKEPFRTIRDGGSPKVERRALLKKPGESRLKKVAILDVLLSKQPTVSPDPKHYAMKSGEAVRNDYYLSSIPPTK